ADALAVALPLLGPYAKAESALNPNTWNGLSERKTRRPILENRADSERRASATASELTANITASCADGALPLVVLELLRALPIKRQCQREGWIALQALLAARPADAIAEQLRVAGALQLVLTTLKVHEDHADVQAAAIGFLWKLAYCDESARKEAAAEGGMTMVLRAMSSHLRGATPVQAKAGVALASLGGVKMPAMRQTGQTGQRSVSPNGRSNKLKSPINFTSQKSTSRPNARGMLGTPRKRTTPNSSVRASLSLNSQFSADYEDYGEGPDPAALSGGADLTSVPVRVAFGASSGRDLPPLAQKGATLARGSVAALTSSVDRLVLASPSAAAMSPALNADYNGIGAVQLPIAEQAIMLTCRAMEAQPAEATLQEAAIGALCTLVLGGKPCCACCPPAALFDHPIQNSTSDYLEKLVKTAELNHSYSPDILRTASLVLAHAVPKQLADPAAQVRYYHSCFSLGYWPPRILLRQVQSGILAYPVPKLQIKKCVTGVTATVLTSRLHHLLRPPPPQLSQELTVLSAPLTPTATKQHPPKRLTQSPLSGSPGVRRQGVQTMSRMANEVNAKRVYTN
ncbi:hypothetical protein T492DRAFT_990533, partial [Pavlovales sp. CCMP2436]